MSGQVWITAVLAEADVEKALVLDASLKRTLTTGRTVALVAPQVSLESRIILRHGFDSVITLDAEECSKWNLKWPDFAKLSALVAFKDAKYCVYLAPSMLVLKNSDEIFSLGHNFKGVNFLAGSGGRDTSVFLFTPRNANFQELLQTLKDSPPMNGSDIGPRIYNWAKGKGLMRETIPGTYNNILETGTLLAGFEEDLRIVNLTGLSQKWNEGSNEDYGTLGNFVVNRWKQLQREYVTPLLNNPVPENLPPPDFSGYGPDSVAIVGMSCRYPESNNLDEFWDLLYSARDATSAPPPARLLLTNYMRNHPDVKSLNAGFIKGPVDEFDGKFFGISPKEVVALDPQIRLTLELVWEALEQACIDPQRLRGTRGSVFFGKWQSDYRDILDNADNSQFFRIYMGNSIGSASARVSHLLGMTGPSVSTESGCSSAHVAVHLACKSLLAGETHLAIACGVNLLLDQDSFLKLPEAVSRDGHCKSFSENADGFARAEGAAVLILKKVVDAVKDGDHIWGVIRGSAIAQEGLSDSMGTPTVHSEAEAMEEALLSANLSPEQITYVECHGTGTRVGDPLEVAAVTKAYKSPLRKEPLIIGSVKSIVGHSESCSGMAGIMKVLLAMKHELIPAQINFTSLNPKIDLSLLPAVIALDRTPWKKSSPGKRRIAGVSSYGITGTDAHIILEEPPEVTGVKPTTLDLGMKRPLHLLKISAKTEEALASLLDQYQEHLATSKDDLADICYSANTGRANFPLRVVVTGETKADMGAALKNENFLKDNAWQEDYGKICFLFTGQGSQYPEMAKGLYQTSPVFRLYFDQCVAILKDRYKIDLLKVLWTEGENSVKEISRTINSQTSIFCVEYGLLKLWESWGIKPHFVLGHSLGEFGAAVAAGILELPDALKLVAERSRLIDNLPGGKMLVIQADQPKVDAILKKWAGGDPLKMLDFAAVNSPEQTVVAGDSEVVLEFKKFCEEKEHLKCLVLEATHAFHSKHMDAMLKPYGDIASTIRPGKEESGVQFLSGMTGELVPGAAVDPQYWVDHTRQPVNFLKAAKTAVQAGCRLFVEIGPQPVLSAMTLLSNPTAGNLTCLPSIRRKEPEWTTMLTSLAKLYCKGVSPDWSGLDQYYPRRKLPTLPHYPFLGTKIWTSGSSLTPNQFHPLLGAEIPNASATKLFQCEVKLPRVEYIKDHVLGDNVIFPGAGYLEMCLGAGLAVLQGHSDSLRKPTQPVKIENLAISAPLGLEESTSCHLQTVVDLGKSGGNGDDPQGSWGGDMSIKICSQKAGASSSWLSHSQAVFSATTTADERLVPFPVVNLADILSRPSDDKTISTMYSSLAGAGLKFGPRFKDIQGLWSVPGTDGVTLVTKVKVPEEDVQYSKYVLHPIILDAMLQSINMLSQKVIHAKRKFFVPIKIGRFVLLPSSSEEPESDYYIQIWAPAPETEANPFTGNDVYAVLLNSRAQMLAVMSGVEMAATTDRAIDSVLKQQSKPLPDMWEETWTPTSLPRDHPVNLESLAAAYKKLEKGGLERYNNLPEEVSTLIGKLERLVYLIWLHAFYQLGWKPVVPSEFSGEELLSQLKVSRQQSKQGNFILRIFEEEGILQKGQGDTWKVVKVPETRPQVETLLSSPEYSSDLQKLFKSTELLQKLGAQLPDVLRGDKSPLPILFPGEDSSDKNVASANNYYGECNRLFSEQPLSYEILNDWLYYYQQQMEESGGGKGVLRVLEVGSGTGSFTEVMLASLEASNLEYEYYFTDISAAFFAAAEKRFEKYAKRLVFKKLNLEEDPLLQGFVPGYFDFVNGHDVIHATRNLRETFTHVATLLRPGGMFDITEQVTENRVISYVFGCLDGFWRFEDFEVRQNHCTLSLPGWKKVLGESGFQVLGTYQYGQGRHSKIMSRKNPELAGLPRPEPSGSPNTWLVFHEKESPMSAALARKIAELPVPRKVVVVTKGKEFKRQSSHEFLIRPDSEPDFGELLTGLKKEGAAIEGILYCWSLLKGQGVGTPQEEVTLPFLNLSKAVSKFRLGSTSKMVVLVSGTMPVGDGSLSNVPCSTFWGFTRSLRNEIPELSLKCVDIGSDSEDASLPIFYELFDPQDFQVGYHQGRRFIPKLTAHKPLTKELELPSETGRYKVILPATKRLADLQFGALDTFLLRPGQVEIQVKCTALNFRDVLSVLKPSDEFRGIDAVGFDFSGVISRVGPEVTKYRVGDRVYGPNLEVMRGGSRNPFPSHVALPQSHVFPVPDEMTLSEASTLPVAAITSHLCLVEIAQIKSTDVVLIHAAAGGVGLKAIDVCNSVGARVIATASSARKHNFLRRLGIQHIFHSRNTSYAQEILAVTNGLGVTVVLNSLTGPGFKEATLKACAPNARFIEISKLSVWTPEEVQKLRPDVFYKIVDICQLSDEENLRVLGVVHELQTQSGFRPLPSVRFPGGRIQPALEFVQNAKHIGKVVCRMPEIRMSSAGKKEIYTPMFHDNATYLITGGLGGIGFEVCKWMVGMGARFVVLVGRKPANSRQLQAISQLNSENDAKVVAFPVDVSRFEECQDLLHSKIPALGYPRLRGVMHSAGTLHDQVVEKHSWDSFSATFQAKVAATQNLHRLTESNLQMEHFVLFSSLAALLGLPGQSNHSAGNGFEDATAHYRQLLGLPATSINWGLWGETGIATEVQVAGINALSTLQGINGLEYCLHSHRPQTCVANIDSFAVLGKLLRQMASYVDASVENLKPKKTANLSPDSFWKQYESAEGADQKLTLLQNEIQSVIRNVLKMNENDAMSATTNFQDLGVDSLMSVEIRHSLQTLFGSRATLKGNILRLFYNVELLSVKLSQYLAGDLDSQENPVPTADQVRALMVEDLHLPEDIRARPSQTKTPVSQISSVLLLGPTGFLGRYIIKEMSARRQISQIICVVRPIRNQSGVDRLKKSLQEIPGILPQVDWSKIRVVSGDIASPHLGMEESVWTELGDKVDAIFNCAAIIQHPEHYSNEPGPKLTRAVNVTGIKNVLEFAVTGSKLKHVYSASSILAVANVDSQGNFPEGWLEADHFDGLTTLSYPITKFIGDMLMKEAVLKRGIPGKSFRFPVFGGDSKTGWYVVDKNQPIQRYIFILKTGLMHEEPFPNFFYPVDTLTRGSVDLFLNPEAPDDIYNVVNSPPAMDRDFHKIAKKFGVTLNSPYVKFAEFGERIRALSTEESQMALFKGNYVEGDIYDAFGMLSWMKPWEKMGDKERENFMVSRKMGRYAPQFMRDKESCMDTLYRDLLFAQKEGWF